ncbi:MAG: hypothetical protein GY949_19640 [Gammaproteobacteria bacterium]|nr:hypothetical protein [Gammaproteobacteria bacterium]
MIPARIEIEFVQRRRRGSVAGVIVLVVGLVAAWLTITDYQDVTVSSELVTMGLARYDSSRTRKRENQPDIDAAEVRLATQQLTTPWSTLLHDLELAAQDSGKEIALLEVAPDKNKKSVRVSGEARSLTHALDYVRRLQNANSLLHPLLENHEILTSNRERPVRFVVLAEWRIQE